MTTLPLTGLELTRAARHWRLYLFRMAPAVAFLALLLLFTSRFLVSSFMEGALFTGDAQAVSEQLSATIAAVGAIYQALVVLGLSPLLAAGAIAPERRDNTLGLLMLADFRGFDIVMAKFAGALLQVFMYLIAVVPLLAFAAFLGGIDVMAALRHAAITLVFLPHAISLSLLMSTLSRSPGMAVFMSYLALGIWLLVTGLADTQLARFGITACVSLPGAVYGVGVALHPPAAAIPYAALHLAAAALSLGLTLWLLPRVLYGPGHAREPRQMARSPYAHAGPLQLDHPARLIAANSSGFIATGVGDQARILAAFLFVLLAVIPGGFLLIAAIVSHEVTAAVQNARQTGLLDDLRTVPERRDRFHRVMLRSQLNQLWLAAPAVLVSNIVLCSLFYGAIARPSMHAVYADATAAGLALAALGWVALLALATAAHVLALVLIPLAMAARATSAWQSTARATAALVAQYLAALLLAVLGEPLVAAVTFMAGLPVELGALLYVVLLLPVYALPAFWAFRRMPRLLSRA